MEQIAQIEKVLFLQRLKVFAHCSAGQVLRLAGIAKEQQFTAGEVIYRLNDPPDCIYCVIEGKVKLDHPPKETATAGENAAFGMLEILSGRLRLANATAQEDTLVLAIDADDFFDLLSNNIEIVRGLFWLFSEAVTAPLAW
ncbi:MAG: cyclic nucleotide-binding domain-containing protein [Acidobacteriota bacterium]